MTSTYTEIINQRRVNDNPAAIETVKALLFDSRFNIGDIDFALDAIKRLKEQPIIKQK